jgi:molybdopterin converting factor subunit 1
MRVTVRFFARLRELAGAESVVLEVAEPATVGTVWQTVSANTPALAQFERAISCAVNANFSRMSHRVSDGDDIAFLPPVSGG